MFSVRCWEKCIENLCHCMLLLVMSMTTVVCQSPTSLRNMRLMDIKQQPQLGTGRREKLKGKVSLFLCSCSNVLVVVAVEVQQIHFHYKFNFATHIKHGPLNNCKQEIHLDFCLLFCGVSVSHNPEEHVHETHGHKKTNSSGHGEGTAFFWRYCSGCGYSS